MNVLSEILAWSQTCPMWQRDALRRLLSQESLTDQDYQDLTELCKSEYGLAQRLNANPLSEAHISGRENTTGRINLHSITHLHGVNALAENQTITFGENLTVIYGDNAAGKSGYTRILKSACKARGTEEILGNILADTAPDRLSVSIKFKAGDNEDTCEWSDTDDRLNRVSVFDSHSASVYLTERTDVAFRPFGLDLLIHARK